MSTLGFSDTKSSDVALHSEVLDTPNPPKEQVYNQALSRLLAIGMTLEEAKTLLKE